LQGVCLRNLRNPIGDIMRRGCPTASARNEILQAFHFVSYDFFKAWHLRRFVAKCGRLAPRLARKDKRDIKVRKAHNLKVTLFQFRSFTWSPGVSETISVDQHAKGKYAYSVLMEESPDVEAKLYNRNLAALSDGDFAISRCNRNRLLNVLYGVPFFLGKGPWIDQVEGSTAINDVASAPRFP
jgi:hypothetical protein